MECSSRMLQHTDAAVKILQDMVLIFGKYYESRKQAVPGLDAPDFEALELNYRTVTDLLASIWPCESQFVAVLGPTGCGKSTLLNNLLKLTCVTGERYDNSVDKDSCRAVLRETAKAYSKMQRARKKESSCPSDEPAGEVLRGSDPANHRYQPIGEMQMKMERVALAGSLGLCCAQDREAYLSTHLPQCDQHPFLLLSGRMGDAGTTKVTAIEWGPKFVGRIRWVSSRKLCKQCRELRHLLQEPEGEMCEADEAKKAELKELWQSLLRMANLWSDSSDIPRPEEALIDELINKLGKIIGLGREEVIETPTTKGSMLDRLAVRDGIHKRLSKEKLGVLVEDLRIQAPIPSSEGGVVLLDVPGTNDPRSLHKKETRDAISQVSLIMLVLDKAVIDKATEKMLEENPVLERMLLAEDADCDLIVVGIAEKGNDRAFSCPEDRIADFDKGGKLAAIINTLLRRKASNLVKSKQLDRDVALARVKRIFDSPNRFSVLPVLPCLASSYHLSPANRLVHEVFCESPDEPTCPLNMQPEELKQKCLKTNIPQLLQRIHLIRRPPIREDLIKGIESALDVADHLTAGHKIDMLVAEFLKLESCHVLKKKPENITLEEPPAVDTEAVTKIFQDCASKSRIDINDLEAVKRQFPSKPKIIAMLGSKAVDDLLQLEAMCLRGFQPKNIGPIAEMLMKPVEQQSSLFIDRAVAKLMNIRNGSTARLDGAFDIVADSGGLGFCTSLYAQLELRRRLTLRQTNARCLDQGRKRLRMALNAANDKGVTHFLKQLKQSSSASFHKTCTDGLSQNVMARKAADVGISSVQSALQTFWDEVADSASNDVQRLWKQWQEEIQKLAKSVAARLTSAATKEGENDNGQERDGCLIEFLVSLKEQKRKLEELKVDLRNEDTATGPSIAEANYGYSLLQKDQQFTFACDPGISQPPVPQAGEQEKTVDLSASGRMDHGVPRLSLPSPRARKNLMDCRDSPEKLEIQGSNVPMRERPSSRTPLASPRGPSDPWTGITREIGSPSQAAIDFRARRRGDISPHGIKKQRVKELSEEEVRQLGTEHPSVESKRKKYVRRP